MKDEMQVLAESVEVLNDAVEESESLTRVVLPLNDRIRLLTLDLSMIQDHFLSLIEEEDRDYLVEIDSLAVRFRNHLNFIQGSQGPHKYGSIQPISKLFERYITLGKTVSLSILKGEPPIHLSRLSEDSSLLMDSLQKFREKRRIELTTSLHTIAKTNTHFQKQIETLSRRIRDQFTSMKQWITYAASASLLLGILWSFLLGRSIVKPVETLSNMARGLAEGQYDQRIEIESQDAIGELAKSFNEMAWAVQGSQEELENLNLGLEKKVTQKTEAIQNLLDHTHQGFLSFDSVFRIQPQFSQECIQIFGKRIFPGAHAAELLFSHVKEREDFEIWMANAFQEKISFAVICDLAPTRVTLDQRILNMEYQKIQNQDQILVMCILTDITDRLELEKQVLKEQSFAKMILRILQGREGFRGYYRDMLDLFKGAHLVFEEPSQAKFEAHTRQIHTLKGNSGIFELLPIIEAFQDYENFLKQETEKGGMPDLEKCSPFLEAIQGHFDRGLQELKAHLGDVIDWDEETVRISLIDFQKILGTLRHKSKPLYRELLVYAHRPFRELFLPFSALVSELSLRLQKATEPLNICGGEFLVDPNLYQDFMRSLVHIFRNALDHGIEPPDEREAMEKNPSGKIQVELSCKDEKIKIMISDDGRGINLDKVADHLLKKGLNSPAEIESMSQDNLLNAIFTPGFSTSLGQNTISGQGVGMDAVRTEVLSMGGEISVESQSGQGTRFLLTLPHLHSLEELWKSETVQNLEKVLVVDDDKLILRLVQRFLEQTGKYKVQACSTAEDALTQLDLGVYEIIIADIQLPGVSGMELIEKLRSNCPLCQVIVITANSQIDYVNKALELGVADYLSKPFSQNELLGAVEAVRHKVARWHRTST
jgi:CheY-like chemotaxis protein/HAMP domain-containing protein